MKPLLLSFFNLVELYLFAAVWRRHPEPMLKARRALAVRLAREVQSGGLDPSMARDSEQLSAGLPGMRTAMHSPLQRVECDANGLPVRLFPLTGATSAESPRFIVIDPRVSGGRPVIARAGVATEVIAERLTAGESVAELAADFGLTDAEIEAAARYERQNAA